MNTRAVGIFVMAALLMMLTPCRPALAGVPANPAVRGQMDAIFAYCERILPAEQEKFRQLKQSIVGAGADHGGDADDPARQGTYRQAYDFISDALAKTPLSQGLQACRSAIKS